MKWFADILIELTIIRHQIKLNRSTGIDRLLETRGQSWVCVFGGQVNDDVSQPNRPTGHRSRRRQRQTHTQSADSFLPFLQISIFYWPNSWWIALCFVAIDDGRSILVIWWLNYNWIDRINDNSTSVIWLLYNSFIHRMNGNSTDVIWWLNYNWIRLIICYLIVKLQWNESN